MLESDCSIKLGNAGGRFGVPDLFVDAFSDALFELFAGLDVVGDISLLVKLEDGPVTSFRFSFGCLVKLANDDKSTSAGW